MMVKLWLTFITASVIIPLLWIRRDVRVVYGAGLENQWCRKAPGVRIPLSPPEYWRSTQVAVRGSPAKGVGSAKGREGSNPSFSAKNKQVILFHKWLAYLYSLSYTAMKEFAVTQAHTFFSCTWFIMPHAQPVTLRSRKYMRHGRIQQAVLNERA